MKRYQVFISSTYVDLTEERNEVMRALLELDCIPSGMELFPAADDSQWEVIKSIIDNCDYYILILGGRYGSKNDKGISYTELEYDYALKKGIPTIAFLHQNIETISLSKSEKTDLGKEKLNSFREKVQTKLCKLWNTPQELGSVVSRSIIQLIKNRPAIGWVRGDRVISGDAASEILKLRNRIEELEKKSAEPVGVEDLQQGDDIFKLKYFFSVRNEKSRNNYPFGFDDRELYEATISTITWNDIFYTLSPQMIDESNEFNLMDSLNQMLERNVKHDLEVNFENSKVYNINIIKDDFQTIVIQLRALKLIEKSEKKRKIDDGNIYWSLTKYGDNLMTSMRTLNKISL